MTERRRKRKRTPSDLRRRINRNDQQLGEARKERRATWGTERRNLAAEHQERKLSELYQRMRALRGEDTSTATCTFQDEVSDEPSP
jgi:hypothetical protein